MCQIAITDRAVLLRVDSVAERLQDAVQVASTRAESLDVIVTRNTDDFADVDIPILTPDQFLIQLAANRSSRAA